MKKLILFVSILTFLFAGSSISYASTNTILKTSQIVSKVSYSKADKVFYLYTKPASDGCFWVVSVNPKGKTLKQVQTSTIGHTIDIYYVIDEAADDEKEIVKTVIH